MTSPWHGAADWDVGQLVTAADMNAQVRDNIGYLFERPTAVITSDEAGNFITTSTAWVNVDATDMALALDLEGTRARVTFQGMFRVQTSSPGTGRLYLDITVDGVRQAGDDGITMLHVTSDDYQPLGFSWVVTGLTPGAHTFALQWRAMASVGTPTATLFAGAGTTGFDVHPQLSVEEF